MRRLVPRSRLARAFVFSLAIVAAPLASPTASADAGLRPSHPTSPTSAGSAGLAPATPTTPTPPWLVRTGKLATGWDALDKGDFATATADLKAVTGKDAARATLGLARVAYETGDFANAESLARKASSLAGSDLVVKYEATAWAAKVLFAQGKVDDARKLVEPLRDEMQAPRARGLFVEILVRQGDRDEARKAADALEADSEGGDPVFQDPALLATVGSAAHAVRDVKYASSTFKAADRIQKKNVEVNLAWAELFLDYYDVGHAKESLRDILAVAPDHPRAHLLTAEIALADTFDWDAAEREITIALKENPKLAHAYFLRGSMALHDGDLVNADAAVTSGLAIDPNDLELLSLRAAIRFLDDDKPGFERAKADVFKRNPKFSGMYGIINEFAEWEHRYDDIVEFMREAVALDPDDGKAWSTLGFNLLRRGEEADGLKALDIAYKKDKYNVRLVNMLNLFERTIAKKFDTYDGTGDAAPFKFRLDKEEAPLMSRYVPKMFGTAWGVMVKKYGFTPTGPVQIEIYPERENFSVRSDGLPNVGASGICFGHVVTAVSPKHEPSNWGVVLWHELGHVFAIQLSKSHVPRWFTEGLSEYETIVTRPEWHRALDPQLYAAFRGGRLPKVAEMNHAFTHAKSGNDVITAYYASSQMIVFIAETYGFPSIVKMLKLWGAGKTSGVVIQEGLGLSSDELDAAFRVWLGKRLSRYDGQFIFDEASVPTVEVAKAAADAAPRDGHAAATYAAALFVEGKYPESDTQALAALAIDPSQNLAHYIAAKTAFGLRKDVAGARAHVVAIVKSADGYVAETMLADLAEASKDEKGKRAALEKAASFDPSQVDPLLGLYKLALEEKRDDDALNLLRKMVTMDPHERLPWNLLMEDLGARGLWDELLKVGEGAIYVDPYSPFVHAMYARALTMKGRLKEAGDEVDAGMDGKPKPEGEALLHVERARIAWKSKDIGKAKGELDAAVKLDPKSKDAATLQAEVH